MRCPARPKLVAIFGALLVVATACGSGTDDTSTAAVTDGPANVSSGPDSPDAAAAAAVANIEGLTPSDDVRLIEVLDVESGGVTTLADAVDGDRPVLLWFWAPH